MKYSRSARFPGHDRSDGFVYVPPDKLKPYPRFRLWGYTRDLPYTSELSELSSTIFHFRGTSHIYFNDLKLGDYQIDLSEIVPVFGVHFTNCQLTFSCDKLPKHMVVFKMTNCEIIDDGYRGNAIDTYELHFNNTRITNSIAKPKPFNIVKLLSVYFNGYPNTDASRKEIDKILRYYIPRTTRNISLPKPLFHWEEDPKVCDLYPSTILFVFENFPKFIDYVEEKQSTPWHDIFVVCNTREEKEFTETKILPKYGKYVTMIDKTSKRHRTG